EDEVTQVRDCIPDNWKKARIGRNDDVTRIESIRSDKIQWLKPAMGQPIANYLSKMEEIRQEVNRHFFLG
ncbi:SM-20 protein, partial [Vibrio parahaemolyticus]